MSFCQVCLVFSSSSLIDQQYPRIRQYFNKVTRLPLFHFQAQYRMKQFTYLVIMFNLIQFLISHFIHLLTQHLLSSHHVPNIGDMMVHKCSPCPPVGFPEGLGCTVHYSSDHMITAGQMSRAVKGTRERLQRTVHLRWALGYVCSPKWHRASQGPRMHQSHLPHSLTHPKSLRISLQEILAGGPLGTLQWAGLGLLGRKKSRAWDGQEASCCAQQSHLQILLLISLFIEGA